MSDALGLSQTTYSESLGGSPGDSNMQLRPRSSGTKILNFRVHNPWEERWSSLSPTEILFSRFGIFTRSTLLTCISDDADAYGL